MEVPNGFRGNRGCADAIFVLRQIIDQHVIKNKQLHVCFIDIAKAYDSIDRDTAWDTLLHRGAAPKIIRLLRDLHQGTSCTVRAPGLGWGNRSSRDRFQARGCDLTNGVQLVHGLCSPRCDAENPQKGHQTKVQLQRETGEGSVWNVAHEDLVWILLYAADIALMAEDLADLQGILTELDSKF